MSSGFFLQFCDIKKLAVIFNNIANLVEFILSRKFPIFCQENEQNLMKKKKKHCMSYKILSIFFTENSIKWDFGGAVLVPLESLQ
jgi:hypothetical protein